MWATMLPQTGGYWLSRRIFGAVSNQFIVVLPLSMSPMVDSLLLAVSISRDLAIPWSSFLVPAVDHHSRHESDLIVCDETQSNLSCINLSAHSDHHVLGSFGNRSELCYTCTSHEPYYVDSSSECNLFTIPNNRWDKGNNILLLRIFPYLLQLFLSTTSIRCSFLIDSQDLERPQLRQANIRNNGLFTTIFFIFWRRYILTSRYS